MKKVIITTALTVAVFAAPAYAKEYTVEMISTSDKGDYRFSPQHLTIQPGDTVTWINAQDDSHNVMTSAFPKGAEGFDSPMLEKKGQKWSYIFKKDGTYEYHCHPHADLMNGTVTVGKPSAKADIVVEGHHHSHGNHEGAHSKH
jgi:plastocyanin